MRKAIICGGRDFDESNYFGIREKLISLLQSENITEEVCGMAVGADMFGSMVAHCMNMKVTDFYADWNMTRSEFANDPKVIKTTRSGHTYNAVAGINRNKRMAEYVKNDGICIALPGGSGTENMIEQAKKNNIPVFRYNILRGMFDKL